MPKLRIVGGYINIYLAEGIIFEHESGLPDGRQVWGEFDA